jgi:hypothetical protein
MRTSYAGLQLLEHWAEKYPKIAAFLAQYKSKKAIKEITEDCFDLANGVRPASFLKIDELNKVYEIKAENRRLKREAEQAKRNMIIWQSQQASNIASQQSQLQAYSAAQAAYQNALYGKGTP